MGTKTFLALGTTEENESSNLPAPDLILAILTLVSSTGIPGAGVGAKRGYYPGKSQRC